MPLSRFSVSELHRFVVERGVSEASASTIGRWLAADAIKPWHASWIFPRDPDFLQKATPVLELYAGRWEGKPLGADDFVICADAKPSIQARRRIHASAPPAPGGGQLVEHEYERLGAVTYLDAWDVHRGKIMGRTEPKGGIAPFDRLVRQVMIQEPYASAHRVFWIVDNGSDHRGKASVKRLQGRWRNPDSGAPARARQLAQSGRDLPLDHPTQSSPTQRLRRHHCGSTRAQRLRAPPQPDRQTVRLELHPPKARRATRPTPRTPAPTSARARRLAAAALTAGSTKLKPPAMSV